MPCLPWSGGYQGRWWARGEDTWTACFRTAFQNPELLIQGEVAEARAVNRWHRVAKLLMGSGIVLFLVATWRAAPMGWAIAGWLVAVVGVVIHLSGYWRKRSELREYWNDLGR